MEDQSISLMEWGSMEDQSLCNQYSMQGGVRMTSTSHTVLM
jgi:hypothetical protein